jgi:PKD repeat protein
MKYTLLYLGLFIICLEALPILLLGQNSEQPARNSKTITGEITFSGNETILDAKKPKYFMTRQDFIYQNKKAVTEIIDTLIYPLEGTYALYVSDDGGYVTGNNEFGDLAKANYFEPTGKVNLKGILFDFAHATGGNPAIAINIWDNNGTNGSPGTIKASASVNLDIIKNDIINNQMTYIPFDPPVLLTTPFYAGINLPTITGDTLALWSNTDGDTNPGIAWEKWDIGTWFPISSNESWSLDIAQAIFPVVELLLTADFTANPANIQIGQSVNFLDQSIGNPTAWEWIFEGGEPATSGLQNPVVTYNGTGSFKVTLTVWKESESDTKTILNFINVVANPVMVDTLNFPLAGEYAIYITNQNGFVTGNNEYDDRAKANFFQNNQNITITGVLVEFVYATGGNPNIQIALWNNGGNNGTPGAKLGSHDIPLNTIKNHINNQLLTFAPIDPPVNISSSFYAGFLLPTTIGDTLVVWSNMDGNTNPGIAWEQWSDLQWYNFNDPNGWGLNLALAIFPIVQISLGTGEDNEDDVLTVFPNPSNGLFTLYAKSFINESPKLLVFRADGSRVIEKTHQSEEWFSVDLTKEPAGIYFIKIETDSKFYLKKLVKQ